MEKKLYENYHLEYIDYIISLFKKCNVQLTRNQAYIAYSNWSEYTFCAGWENGLEYRDRNNVVASLLSYIPDNKLKFYRPYKFSDLKDKYDNDIVRINRCF